MARVAVVRQGFYPWDPRVRREVEALLHAGHEVEVLCLRRDDEPRVERSGRLTIRRLPLAHERSGALRYVLQYAAFFLAAFFVVGALHARRRYDLVQVHSLPDALVFCALVPRLTGARVILDLHEVMPEFFATRFGTTLDHPAVKVLAFLEQASIRFSSRSITCTEDMKGAFVARGADPGKIGVVLNSADEGVFDPAEYPRRNGDGAFTLIIHGSVEERYGIDTTIEAVRLLADELPDLRLRVYGEGSQLPELHRMVGELGLEDRIWFSDGFVPIRELVQALADADAGVVAMKRDAFRDLTHCNKMFDLVAMRRPAIVSRTQSVESYFDDDCFALFESSSPESLADAIRRLHDDPELRNRLVERASTVNEPYRWPRQREVYLREVERVLG